MRIKSFICFISVLISHFFLYGNIDEISRVYYRLASETKKSGDKELAIKYYKKAVLIDPRYFEAYFYLGAVYCDLERYDEALDCFDAAYKLNPRYYHLLFNKGTILKMFARFNEAIEAYQAYVTCKPDCNGGRNELAWCYLITGQFEKGWAQYNIVRKETTDLSDLSVLDGKTILIRDKVGGFGDIFQFIRYAQLFKQHGATVILELKQISLVPLLSYCRYIDRIITVGDQLPDFDYETTIMHAPCVTNTMLATIPASIPYLYINQEIVDRWKEKLSSDKNFKIGICWSSNTLRNPRTNMVYPNPRSAELPCFYPLRTLEGVSLYSLQRVTGVDQIYTMPDDFSIKTFEGDFDKTNGRFVDTAAVMKNLDLVITIDTSTAHLAGALGAPVWVMLPLSPDWRWLVDRSDSPWYPTMRLFRQKKRGDWAEVMEEIVSELRTIVR